MTSLIGFRKLLLNPTRFCRKFSKSSEIWIDIFYLQNVQDHMCTMKYSVLSALIEMCISTSIFQWLEYPSTLESFQHLRRKLKNSMNLLTYLLRWGECDRPRRVQWKSGTHRTPRPWVWRILCAAGSPRSGVDKPRKEVPVLRECKRLFPLMGVSL